MRVLIANFILVPLLTYYVLQIFQLDMSLSIGLFLVGSAAGAPFLIKLTTAAEQNVAISASLLVLLIPATILYMPFVVPLALPRADVNALAIAIPLVVTMLLPLAVGLFFRGKFPHLALRFQPVMALTSTIALILLVLLTLGLNFEAIIDLFGTGAILAAIVVITGAFVIGFVIGSQGSRGREELALATAQRNIAAATIVATQTIGLPGTLNMVVVTSLIGLAILFPVAISMRPQGNNKHIESDKLKQL